MNKKIFYTFLVILFLSIAYNAFLSKPTEVKAAGLATGSWTTFGYNNQHVNRIMAPTISSGATVKWKTTVGTMGWNYQAIASDGTIYVGGYSTDKIYALNPNGTIKWSTVVSNPYGTISIRDDGRVVATNGNFLYIINQSTGAIITTKRLWDDVEFSGTGMTIGADGSMYSSSNFTNYAPGNINKWDINGNQLWSKSYFEGTFFPLAMNNGNNQLVFAQAGTANVTPKRTATINLSNGTTIWTNDPGRYSRTAPMVLANGDIVVGYGNGDLRLYNGTNGVLKWNKPLTGSIEPGNIAEGFDSTIYAANYSGGKLFAYDINGTKKWELALNNPQGIVVVNNVIYVKSKNSPLTAVSLTGTKLWEITTTSMTRTTVMTVANDGTIYFNGTDGKMYAVSGTLSTFNLNVTKTGAGQGTITSSPLGINCGSDCSESYNGGTSVVLNATADAATSVFTGWSGGGCSGTSTCSVTMDAAKTVTANFDLKPLPQVDFSITNSSGVESTTPALLNVRLSSISTSDVIVDYAVTGGDAIGGGNDYILTIPAGSTSANISISIINDTSIESDETIIVKLSNPFGATLGGQNPHTYTITNDDTITPTLQFLTPTSENSESTALVNIPVSLSPPASTNVIFDFTVAGDATAADYTITSGPITIPVGSNSANIPITIINDTSDESDETIALTLINVIGATVGVNGVHVYKILDDDASAGTASGQVKVKVLWDEGAVELSSFLKDLAP